MTSARLVAGKVVLVTGAGSGIGRAVAQLCASEGAVAVAIVDRDDGPARATAELVREQGAEALPIRADVARREEVDAFVAAVVDRYGRLDCAVNNAGVPGPLRRLADHTDADWAEVVGVNLDGVFYCMRAEILTMLGHGGGAIVNMSSAVVVTAEPGQAAYGATKSAVVGLTKAAAGEYAADGVRINAVLPGAIHTPLLERYIGGAEALAERHARAPMKRLGTPAELAEAAVWLCSDRASYVHGVGLRVDGAKHSFTPNRHSDPERFGTRR